MRSTTGVVQEAAVGGFRKRPAYVPLYPVLCEAVDEEGSSPRLCAPRAMMYAHESRAWPSLDCHTASFLAPYFSGSRRGAVHALQRLVLLGVVDDVCMDRRPMITVDFYKKAVRNKKSHQP
eukprot:1157879-Pelagomonas_calceolata.AAC.1